jgi:hypothetical protein
VSFGPMVMLVVGNEWLHVEGLHEEVLTWKR